MEPSPPERNPAAAEAALIALYAWAQTELLRGLFVILADTEHTMAGMQTAMGAMRALVRRVLATLQVRTDTLIRAMVDGYAASGSHLAEEQVAGVPGSHLAVPGDTPGGPPAPPTSLTLAGDAEPDWHNLSTPHGDLAADAIARDMAHRLGDVRERITRLPDDVYKAIAPHGAIRQVLDNGWTPHQSQAAAWRVFLAQGVTGFTDRAGRRWNLATYTEMAVRTAAMRAFNDAHLARGRALGVRFWTVHPHRTACPLCWPWEGKVLTEHLERVEPGVPVSGTIAGATQAGLFHPNCRHALAPFLPGYTPLPEPRPEWSDVEQQQYDDTQRQRAYERAIRQAKTEQAFALDPAEARRAGRRVRTLQAAVRGFVAERDHLSRASSREQPNLGYGRVRLPQPQ